MTVHLHWTAGLHHDGSALYVSNPLPRAGETVTITLRAPANAPIRHIFLRTTPDGEEHMEAMRRVRDDGHSAWWQAALPVTMPRMGYRFKVLSAEGAFWHNAHGAGRADSPDANDFRLLADFAAPAWLEDAVFYQIFPDRFCNGDPANDVPNDAWSGPHGSTVQRAWGEPPLKGGVDFFGGDLAGIAQKLDYLRDLGVNALYLNPIFTAYTNHRYDTADYEAVDRHLGGDAALAELRRALDRAGMRLVLDITPNHCGARHPWFLAARANPHAPTAEYFMFRRHPDDYESWLGHKSLVKLDYRSQRLRQAMYAAPESALRRWLREPFRIDGWRLDVANMTARSGFSQLEREVWREVRRAVKGDRADAYLFGENFFDGTPYLQGDELDAVMNYQGFTIPLWQWLQGVELPASLLQGWDWIDPFPMAAETLAEQWARFHAAVPWAVTRQQFNQLGSHDTPRILSLLRGDKNLLRLAVSLLMTFPGVPCIYYGDEIGLDGWFDPDNRRCMPWDESAWDADLRAFYRRLIGLRRALPALRRGGFQMLYAQGGLLAYQRESAEGRLLAVGYRGPQALESARIPVWHGGLPDGAALTDLIGGATFHVAGGALALGDLQPGAALLLG